MGSFESASVSLWLRENSIETEQSGEPERGERRASHPTLVMGSLASRQRRNFLVLERRGNLPLKLTHRLVKRVL